VPGIIDVLWKRIFSFTIIKGTPGFRFATFIVRPMGSSLQEAFNFPGRYIKYKWDGPNMRITNFEQANQFIKREYRDGWGELKL